MTNRDLILELIHYPMDASIEIEVKTDTAYDYSASTVLSVNQKSDNWIVISGEE